MKKSLKFFSFLLIVIVIWLFYISNKVKNYEKAFYEKKGEIYKIQLRGVRRLMSHDPISALLGKTYIEEIYMQVPRITGIIMGSEIPVEYGGNYQYSGSININGQKMKIELYYPSYEEKIPPYETSPKKPLYWNGSYQLKPFDDK